MENKAVSGIMLTLLISMLTLAFNIQPIKAEPGTWYVDDSGGADFTRIQDAINAANPGDTIYVYSGTYFENVLVNKAVSLVGESRDTTIIDAGGIGEVVKVTTNSVALTNFTMQRSGGAMMGLRLQGNDMNIQNNIVTNTGGGFELDYGSNNTLRSNLIANNFGVGIALWYSSNNKLLGNNITGNAFEGIRFEHSSNNQIVENNITNNGDGIDLLWSSDNNNVTGNNIVANKYSGVFIKYSSSISIVGNNITNNGDGVYIDSSSDSVIYGNNITNNRFNGLVVGYFSGNKFYHNNLINNNQQVQCTWSLNTWDDGYPSGGNYWSDYSTRYPDAQELDDSGIWNAPYVIDSYNQDNYPLMEPWTPTPPAIMANIDFGPDTLNLQSKGKWITAYFQLPEGYNAADVNASTIMLNGTILPVLDPKYGFVTNSSEYLVDHNGDGILERMVKFDRTSVASLIYQSVGMRHEVRLALTGQLTDGTQFEGINTIFAFWQSHKSPSKR